MLRALRGWLLSVFALPSAALSGATASLVAEAPVGIATFAEAAMATFWQREAGWKNRKHRAQVMSTLKAYAFPVIGNLPVDTIDTPAVLKVLQPIWNEKTETASRLRGRIEAVLARGQVSGYRTGDNPARWSRAAWLALPWPSRELDRA